MSKKRFLTKKKGQLPPKLSSRIRPDAYDWRTALWYQVVKAISQFSDYRLSQEFGSSIIDEKGNLGNCAFEHIRIYRRNINPKILDWVESKYPGTKKIYRSALWDFLANPYADIRQARAFQLRAARALGLDKNSKYTPPKSPNLAPEEIHDICKLYDFSKDEYEYMTNPIFKELHNVISRNSKESLVNQIANSLNLALFYGGLYREAYLAGKLRIAVAIQYLVRDSFSHLNEFGGLTRLSEIDDEVSAIFPMNKRDMEMYNRKLKLLTEQTELIGSINEAISKAILVGAILPTTILDPNLSLFAQKAKMPSSKKQRLQNFLEYNFDFQWKN